MTERHADLLSKYVLETLKEVDLIDEFQKVLKAYYIEHKQLIAWLETACFELSQLPKKDKATLLVPPEFQNQMELLKIPLKFTLAKGKKKSEDDADANSIRFASELPDAAMHFRAVYLAIQELFGIITTSGLYLQLLEDPIAWGRNSPEGKEAIDSLSSKYEDLLNIVIITLTTASTGKRCNWPKRSREVYSQKHKPRCSNKWSTTSCN